MAFYILFPDTAMASIFHRLSRSLEIRLILPLAATVAVVCGAHAFLAYWSIRDQASRFVLSDVERTTALIRSVTHDGMLLNRMSELQTRIERLGASPGLVGVRVYAKDGRIALSSARDERGQIEYMDSRACSACHPQGVERGPSVLDHRNVVGQVSGSETRRCLAVIENEPACAAVGCHPTVEESPVLGVLDVQMSMGPFDEAMAASRGQLALATGGLILAGAVFGALCIRHFVHGPVARLHEGTRRIASGDLTTRIDVRGSHELAELAGAFNSMVADLSSAQDELAEWSRTLERRVDEKAAELREAQKHLTRAETMSSLGKLAATVAHELNNPMTGILTYARLVRRELAEQPLDEATRADLDRCLELVDKECERCGGIVKNLLVFARGSAVRLASTDMSQIVNRCLMLVRHHLEMHNIRLDVSTEGDNWTIVADQGQLHQAVLAVLMNAIEAMQAVPGRPGVLGVEVIGADEQVTVRIRDSGVGIAEDVIAHIFEPFFTTKGESSGVGLGLSVVYGVVHGHGGEITVSSRPGEGAVFTMTFPRQRPGEGTEQPGPAAAMEVVR
ncbi:MAG: Adaptive-response sensory-kinase SasA [Phycisphaerales bacterium]|nr:Adaptive-response sensory-kinase SasA [Phycisphaerales bacterium]